MNRLPKHTKIQPEEQGVLISPSYSTRPGSTVTPGRRRASESPPGYSGWGLPELVEPGPLWARAGATL